jgi:zinc protease
MLTGITLEEVNAALERHLRADRLKIAIVTGEAENLRAALIGDTPSPVTYESAKTQPILDEDELIERHALGIDAENVTTVAVEDIFQR